jgi:acetolactate synthase-1/3 small subunit
MNSAKFIKKTINCLVRNEQGALERVIGAFSGRGFDIETLVIAKTLDTNYSQITVTTTCPDIVVQQLQDVIPICKVTDFTHSAKVEREILLLQLNRSNLPLVGELCRTFNAKMADIALDTVVIELCAKSSKIDAFVELMRPYGIAQLLRSGSCF